ncbi:MAG: PD-(D/E)XK nuclease family protein [Cytophagales bacterium]
MYLRENYLKNVVAQVYQAQCGDLDGVVFVLPSQVAAYDVRQHLASLLKGPIWSPPTLVWHTFLRTLAPCELPSEEVLLGHLHQVVMAARSQPASFGDFEGWGNTFLRDLDQMTHALVDPGALFAGDVSKETAAVAVQVTKFWQHMRCDGKEGQKVFCASWDALSEIHKMFCAVLEAHGLLLEAGYYKTLYNRLVKGEIPLPYKRIVLVGMEEATPLVAQIFKTLSTLVPVDFYNDGGADLMPSKEGGQKRLAIACKDLVAKKRACLTLLPSKTALGQTDLVVRQMVDLINQKGLAICQHMALILADESLLIPLLHALPDDMPLHLNIGYRLAYTPLYALLSDVLACYENWGTLPFDLGWQQVKKISQHPYVTLDAVGMNLVSQRLKRANHLEKEPEKNLPAPWVALCELLEGKQTTSDVWQGIRHFLHALSDDEGAERATWEALSLEKALEVCEKFARAGLSVKASAAGRFFKLFSHRLAQTSLAINGDHRQGVLVLSRSQADYLERPYVFVLSMNEGIFPRCTVGTSLVPLALRKAYGLPSLQTQQANDGLFFYRLLKQTAQVHACYHQDDISTPSRFLLPFCHKEALSGHESGDVVIPVILPIIVEKNTHVFQALDNLLGLTHRHKILTPSQVNTYLDCRLRFFFQYIAQLGTEVEKAPIVAPAVLGNMLHKVLKVVYEDVVGQQVTATHIENMQRHLPEVVKQVMQKCHDANPESFQRNTQPFISSILSNWAGQVLLQDKKQAPFQLIGVEFGGGRKLMRHLTLDDQRKIPLGGIIDRIDQQGDTVRVVDYKTGRFQPRLEAVAMLFNRERPDRNKIALQLLWYAWLYRPHLSREQTCQPTVISMREIFATAPQTMLVCTDKGVYQPMASISSHEKVFEDGLRKVIQEMLDPKQPFNQTSNLAHCRQCPYRTLCQR